MVQCISNWHAKNPDCTHSMSDIRIILFIMFLVSLLSQHWGEEGKSELYIQWEKTPVKCFVNYKVQHAYWLTLCSLRWKLKLANI